MVGEWKGGEEIRKDKRKRKEREVSEGIAGEGGDRRHNSAECRLRPEVLDGQRDFPNLDKISVSSSLTGLCGEAVLCVW